jgi:hypothetical protein
MDIAAKAYWMIVEQLRNYARSAALPPIHVAYNRHYVMAATGIGESGRHIFITYSNGGLSYSMPSATRSAGRSPVQQLVALETNDGGIELRDGSETITVGAFVDKVIRMILAEPESL